MSASEKKSRRRFTLAFRAQAVKRVLVGHGVAMVARELGIRKSLLHNWVTQHRLVIGTAAVQAAQAAEITPLKRALAQKDRGGRHLKKSDGVLCQGIPVR